MKCCMCKNEKVKLFLDLGFVPLVDRFLTKNELNEAETLYPLKVYLCQNCGLSQLGFRVEAEKLFNENYAYESTGTISRHNNYSELSEFVCKKFNLEKNSLVVDIGSNVGLLLSFFKEQGMHVIGIDASKNIVDIANSKGIETKCSFFNEELVNEIINERKTKAKIITATNVFAHIQDYDSFMKSLLSLLDEKGIFVFQVPHFLQLINNFEYDTIYHEHICYFGLKPLLTFFKKFGMELFDIHQNNLDGGSIRCFVSKWGNFPVSNNVEKILEQEEKEKIYDLERLQTFAKNVQKQRYELKKLLICLKENNSIVGIGAPAKGMTLLNYCKIDDSILSYVTEKSNLKVGKFTPGMHIHVKTDEEMIKDNPDYALILAWNFAEEIMNRLSEYKKNGGKFIIPVPIPKIIN